MFSGKEQKAKEDVEIKKKTLVMCSIGYVLVTVAFVCNTLRVYVQKYRIKKNGIIASSNPYKL